VALASTLEKEAVRVSATPEKASRQYYAPRRLASARETKDRIRRSATELFLADGFSSTSVRSIARAAGVSEKTVYLQFETKLALLKEVVETALVGDTDAVAAADRQWFRDLIDSTDAQRKLTLLSDATAALHERTGAVFAMARGAAEVDQEAAALWAFGKRGHRADMALVAASLDGAGLLTPARNVEWAAAVLYVLIGPETWHLMRVELGYDASGYRDWLHATLVQTFLATADS
jgi:AcrR family transcriptional regulator